MEIRAAALSGDCFFAKEFRRGEFGYVGHLKECVRRRALKSVHVHPSCSGITGEKAVNDVFESCFADRAPFGVFPQSDKSVGFWDMFS